MPTPQTRHRPLPRRTPQSRQRPGATPMPRLPALVFQGRVQEGLGERGKIYKRMKVLVACESSATVRRAFERKGCEAWSCDTLPSEVPGNHYQCDVREVLGQKWDLIIAHPPCTRLCNSGVRWLEERNLWDEMREAAEFFKLFLRLGKTPVAIENPIMHGYAKKIVGCGQTQTVQPWMFGHGETKATCLWLKYLPNLLPTNVVEGRDQRVWSMPPGPDRWKERSRTLQGFADAMADQWTKFLLNSK